MHAGKLNLLERLPFFLNEVHTSWTIFRISRPQMHKLSNLFPLLLTFYQESVRSFFKTQTRDSPQKRAWILLFWKHHHLNQLNFFLNWIEFFFNKDKFYSHLLKTEVDKLTKQEWFKFEAIKIHVWSMSYKTLNRNRFILMVS